MSEHSPLIVYASAPDVRAAFTIVDTARLLSVSVETVRKEIRAGRLQTVRLSEKTVPVPAWSIEALLAPERRVTAVEDGAIG